MNDKRFILIDNSIVDTSGHHYQYAASCLEAAESLGFKPVLATNVKYSNLNESRWKTLSVYEIGFWGGDEKSKALSIFKFFDNLSRSNKKRKFLSYIKRRYSSIGFLWESQSDLSTYFNNRIMEKNTITNSKYYFLFLVLTFGIPAKIYLSLKKGKGKKITTEIRRYYEFFKTLIISQTLDPINGAKQLDTRKKIFAKDTKDLFDKIGFRENDQVFIPTAGFTEMLGVLEFFKNNPDASMITWHFLFRRNIFAGSRYDYFKQQEQTRAIRNAFQIILAEIPHDKIFFYTDTEELTNQYNSLGLKKFVTVPIPHTTEKQYPRIDPNKIIISYLGDAREEKGYQFLPNVIQDLWNDYVKTNKILFKIQSNFNVPRGEPKVVVAKSQLDALPKDKVEVISEPLSIKDYSRLLLNSNVIILPYDRLNYFARSSGILAEALAAGIPVLIPAGCWMARQFHKKTYEYHISLKDSLRTVSTIYQKKFRWHPYGFTKYSNDSEYLTFSDYSNRLITIVKLPPNATHFVLSFDFTDDSNESIIGGHVRFLTRESISIKNNKFIMEKEDSMKKGTQFYEIPRGVPHMMIELFNPDSKNTIRISNFQIEFMENSNPYKIPLNTIGQVFANPDEISEKLLDLINNYTHYLSTAKEFSKEYFIYHNAKRLVSIITNSSVDQKTLVRQK